MSYGNYAPQSLTTKDIWTWDSWYLELPAPERESIFKAFAHRFRDLSASYPSERPCFLLGFLNAPRSFYDGQQGPNQHHFQSRVGLALTSDFVTYQVLTYTAFTALPEESSIWGSSFVPGPYLDQDDRKGRRQYLFFYTSRNPQSPFGLSQEIRLAVTEDFSTFRRTSLVLKPDQRWYQSDSLIGDTAIHAFRDPFPWLYEGRAYLLISAKANSLAPGIIGKELGGNGVVAIYRATAPGSLTSWEATPLCFAVGRPEAEVAQLYYQPQDQQHFLCFSAQSDESYLTRTASPDGLPQGSTKEEGHFFQAPIADLSHLLQHYPTTPVKLSVTALPLEGGPSYANRLVPELGGITVGFDLAAGNTRITSRQQRPELQAVSQDFGSFAPL